MKRKHYPRKPVTKGKAKVPVVMQMEALECGAASLTMIAAYYGLWIPLEQVRKDCGVSRDGSNAKNVLKAARNYGFHANGYRMEPEELKKKGKFPCIIHWNFNHFVVLNGFKGRKAYLNDPAKGEICVTTEEFDEAFTGICLFFEPSEAFVPEGKPKSMLSFAKERLKGSGPAMTLIILTTFIASLLTIVNPAFSKIFLDRLLTGQNTGWLYPFTLLLAAVAVLQIITEWIKYASLFRVQGKFAMVADSKYMWHVLRLPVEFFSQRMAGDIAGRQTVNAQIANSLVNTLAPLVLETVMLVFYLIVMIRYSLPLAAVCLLSVTVNALFNRYISKKRVNISRVQMRDAGKLAAATVAGIEMIETIKASGAENGFFERWAGYQASVNDGRMRYQKVNAYLGMLPNLVSALCNIVVLGTGVYLIMQGKFTVGAVLAFQGYMTAFNAPAQKLTEAGQMLQEMRTNMERVEDVMKYPVDRDETEAAPSEKISFDKLRGKVELKNISFGYSRLSEPLIKNFNLKLEPGKSVAFVGGSGCGKSTLSKLISGLYEPWEGEILFDDIPMKQINHAVFTGSLAVVDQDIILFEDTIANNIKMRDSSIEDFEMILAARDAQIHDAIIQRDKGYQYPMLEGGKDFSGGQRQRLEIARVLAQDPTVVILDEATSALDAKTEYDVIRSIRNRGITMIVIAHRLSTIRDCDEILVLDRGNVVERGRHEELMKLNGKYAELISSE